MPSSVSVSRSSNTVVGGVSSMPSKSHIASAAANAAIAGSALLPALRSICIAAGCSFVKHSAQRRWPMISAPRNSWLPQQ